MDQAIIGLYVAIIRPLITAYTIVILASVIMSWLIAFNVVNPRNEIAANIMRIIYMLTEPVLRPIRNLLPSMGGIDLSPMLLLLGLWWLNDYVLPPLFFSLASLFR